MGEETVHPRKWVGYGLKPRMVYTWGDFLRWKDHMIARDIYWPWWFVLFLGLTNW